MTASQASEIKQAEERFAAADKNADGKLTLEEAKAGMPRIASAFSKIDVDKNRTLADKFQIRSVPTMILFKDGKSVWRQSGVIPASTLESIIKQHSK